MILAVVIRASGETPPPRGSDIKIENHAFRPGERLTYDISWSNFIKAGTAVMEVNEDTMPDGRKVYRITSTARSAGLVKVFYSVHDVVESTMDCEDLDSLRYASHESHGKKTRRKEMTFDYATNTVTTVINNDKPQTFTIPPHVQDPLSSLYYLRTMNGLVDGKSVFIDVHDSDKNWSVEVRVLGKEKISTPAGEFDAIKVRTYPKYEGVFQNKGEIDIWLTDDESRTPVLMKSKISIGSIVATLVDMKGTVKK